MAQFHLLEPRVTVDALASSSREAVAARRSPDLAAGFQREVLQ